MPELSVEASLSLTDLPFFSWADENGPEMALGKALDSIQAKAAKSVALDETMRADFAMLVLDALPNDVHREFTPNTLGALRMRKSDDEFTLLKQSALVADSAMKTAFSQVKPGMTESQIADVIKAHFTSCGASPLFWIVGASENGAFPHHSVSERVVKQGDAIVVDIGARKAGYPSDITRMIVLGEPTAKYRQVHDIVEQAVQAALAACKPGVLAKDVDAAARDVITQAGFGDYFVHRTGHGLGIDGHEPPYITKTAETVLDEGMVFSIEPGIYLPGEFGVRLEEIVIMRADGAEVFSELPRAEHVVKCD
jgi:Xaa-Pro aminopeptidase